MPCFSLLQLGGAVVTRQEGYFMPKITIEIYGHYADLARTSKREMEVPEGTVGGMVAGMKRSWPRDFVEAVMDEEGKEFNLGILVMINSHPVYHLQGMETKLEEGDKVIFLPPMAGGSCDQEIQKLEDSKIPMVESSPAIGTDGTIYVGSSDKKLYALKPDGTLKCSYTTGGTVRSSRQ